VLSRFRPNVNSPPGVAVKHGKMRKRDSIAEEAAECQLSSSFGSVRKGMGDFGIAFLPGGERDGKLGR